MIVVGHQQTSGVPILTGDDEHALVIGPPRSGKTSGFLVPTILSHPGPVVATSSKLDVATWTAQVRGKAGPVWWFGLGDEQPGPGMTQVGWDPVSGCRSFDESLRRARAMTGATIRRQSGGDGEQFWTDLAESLLAALLHAAAMGGRTIADAAFWLLTGRLEEPIALLREHDAWWAAGTIDGIDAADGRLRDSATLTARNVLRVYDSQVARAALAAPRLDFDELIERHATLFIVGSAANHELMAPIVVGLLEALKEHTYQSFASRSGPPVLFALDELATIAPIHSLPALLAEGGSQGVQVLGCLQDLSQARHRWGGQADGLLTLFRHKVLLPGVADRVTLESLSLILGERTSSPTSGSMVTQAAWSPSRLSSPPLGTAIHIDRCAAELVQVIGPQHLGRRKAGVR